MGLYGSTMKEETVSVSGEESVQIPSCRIETKKENQQLSKQKTHRLKGKKTRTNRGNNR